MTSLTFFSSNRYAAPIAAATLLLLATEPSALGGTVVDESGAAVSGATVTLVSDTSVHQTTDESGAFTLDLSTAIFVPANPGAAGPRLDHLGLRDGALRFSLSSPAREGVVSLFASDGSRLFETSPRPMGAGEHRVELPRLAPGLHHVRVALDGRVVAANLIAAGDRATASPATAAPRRQTTLARAAATNDAVDTLRIGKEGHLTTWLPVESYAAADLEIVLPEGAPLPPVTDYSADGPFATVVEANVGPGNAYTIIRPETLGADGFKHAPIIYGHGINGQVSGFTNFLRNVASHGFVIIACNVLTGGPNAASNTNAMTDGLNWILAQDTVPGIYQGNLATKRAASMGYSVGGTAAVDIGGHEAIKTVVSIHGHISTATLHGTLLQTSGTEDNVGLPMQQETFDSSDVQTFLGTVTDAGHGYIQNDNGGVQRPAIVAWLRYWLYNDQGAKHYFYGDDCVMCTAPWENPQRKNWE